MLNLSLFYRGLNKINKSINKYEKIINKDD